MLPNTGLAAFVQNIGGEAHKHMYGALSRLDVPISKEVDERIQYFLGDLPRGSMPQLAEARLVGADSSAFPADVQVMAAVMHFGCRLWTGSFLSKTMELVREKKIKPICTVLYGMYDETPH